MSTHDPLEELLPLYALGALTEAERTQVEAYVAVNPAARARLDDLLEAAAAVPLSAAPAPPPPEVRRALMARVRRDARLGQAPAPAAPAPTRPRVDWRGFFRRLSPALAAASLAVAVAASGWAGLLNSEVTRLRAEAEALRGQLAAQADLAGQIAELRQETDALRRELREQRVAIAFVTAPGSQATAIAGTEQQPAASGQLIHDPRASASVLVVSGLQPLPAGQAYQFWLIKGDTPIGAGLFEVDAQGRAILEVASTANPAVFDAIGVSIEPAGGSPQPTGDIVMLGRITRS